MVLPSLIHTPFFAEETKRALRLRGIDLVSLVACDDLRSRPDETTGVLLLEVRDHEDLDKTLQWARMWRGWVPVFLAHSSSL